MRYVIIPDVHGRSFWRKAVAEAGEAQIVFLGDYLDPYPEEGIGRGTAWDGFMEIVALKRAHPERITLLLGNHDLAYVQSAIAGARFDRRNARRNRTFFYENLALFEMTVSIEASGKNYLLSHAGVLPGWVRANVRLLGDCCDIGTRLNKLLHDNANRFAFMMSLADVSEARGGTDSYGSPVWADVSEHATDHYEIKDTYQVFGHTQLVSPLITPYWACLDCRQAFFWDGCGDSLKEIRRPAEHIAPS